MCPRPTLSRPPAAKLSGLPHGSDGPAFESDILRAGRYHCGRRGGAKKGEPCVISRLVGRKPRAVAGALGQIGDRGAVEPLLEQLVVGWTAWGSVAHAGGDRRRSRRSEAGANPSGRGRGRGPSRAASPPTASSRGARRSRRGGAPVLERSGSSAPTRTPSWGWFPPSGRQPGGFAG